MNVIKAIENRRAIYTHQFSGNSVDNIAIRKMLELANWAPTHRRTEPWRFVVFEKKAKDKLLEKLLELAIKTTPSKDFKPGTVEKYNNRKRQVSHVVAIVMERHKERNLPKWEEKASVAMAVQNMWIHLCSTNKYGGYWSTPKMCFTKEFEEHLNLNNRQKCMGIFYVGEIKQDLEWPIGKRENWEDKVQWNS